MCFGITNFQLFKDLKIQNKNILIKEKNNALSLNQFDQNFHFFHGVLFSLNFGLIEENSPKHQTK